MNRIEKIKYLKKVEKDKSQELPIGLPFFIQCEVEGKKMFKDSEGNFFAEDYKFPEWSIMFTKTR